ncbi:MAG: SPFH/Band 7/PHB domain protein [Chloroflexi bacterium]|nr:SPFH/Band 7/PHB domain protein [Chloroflexota bacterium]
MDFVTPVLIAIFVILVMVILASAIRIVPEYKRLILFRLGRSLGARGPGLVWMIPFVDSAIPVDLREVYFDVPPQTCITADNASVSIDFIVYDKVIDPERSVLEVQDFAGAARGLAITTLRAVVGAMDLDEVLSKRDEINRVLHEKLDDVTDRWGIRVMAVEIREVTPPQDVLEAMTRQMAAERTRRATVTEAGGIRESRIITAQGEKEAAILKAEGERKAAILQAEGFALALNEIYKIAQDVDSKTITLQYLEALKVLGEGAATKFVIPTELINLAQPLVENAKTAVSKTAKR